MRRETEFLHAKLAGILREKILSGYIKPGEFLLSENELSRNYRMSRNSVRKSLDQLVAEGLLVKKAGKGTAVPHDVKIDSSLRKVLNIVAPSPSFFVDSGIHVFLDAFRQEYPHVEVKLLGLPTADYWESIRACCEMGLSPDLILVTDTQITGMNNLDAFIDLQSVAAESQSTVYPKVTDAFRREQQIKAVPFTFSTVFLAYNPALFSECGITVPNKPWSQEEFIQAAQLMTIDKNRDGILDQYGFSLGSHMSRWPVFALTNGIKLGEDQGNGNTIKKTFTFFHDILYRYKIAMFYQGTPHRFTSNPFVHGKAGMVLTTTFEIAAWENAGMNFMPSVAPLPLGDIDATLLTANAWMIPTVSNEPELAKTFIELTLRTEVQETMSRTTPFISVHRTVNEATRSPSFLRNLNISGNLMDNNHFLYDIIGNNGALAYLQQEMELFWLGLVSAESISDTWKIIMA